ncbi:hypothetical protein SEA_SNEK_63 [Arthrobacter phage Snek]
MAVNLSPEERLARLPLWAKEEIRRLQQRAFRAEEELALHRSGAYGPADTDTVVDPYRRVPLNLPKGASVEFRLPDGAIRVRTTKDGALELNGDKALTIIPKVTNHFEVRSRSC